VQDLAGLTAVILAGGQGTRLRPVVADQPKVLAEVRGRPFLAYLLEQLADVGVRYVVLCTGYLGEQIQATFGESYGGLDLVYSQEASPLGTAGALRLALPLFKSDSVLVMNGDSFCEVNLRSFWSWHYKRGADATLLLIQMLDTRRYGRVQVDADGLVLDFDEKSDKSGPGWINAGIYLLNHGLLLTIPASDAVSLEQEMFPAWIGGGLHGYRSEGRFLDIGTPEGYRTAKQFFPSVSNRF
jgi:NDP-sugar pyrophosphorylase family protein